MGKHSPDNFTSYVQETLDVLYRSALPRTLINLVLVLDVRFVEELNSGGLVCEVLHKFLCPCAAFPSDSDTKTLNEWIPQYQQNLVDLVNTGRYEGRDDFTVVVQPFLAQTELPREDSGKVDFSYFAPDCFHFSGLSPVVSLSLSSTVFLSLGKGHSVAGLSLWNNMFEPVGEKQRSWHRGEQLRCPTADHPFIYTAKNSLKSGRGKQQQRRRR